MRDAYFELSTREAETLIPQHLERFALNSIYEEFRERYGEVNKVGNRAKILNDPAFGFVVISSLERKENDVWIKSDIFNGPVFPKQEVLSTDDPAEALARCLNDKGKVDLVYVGTITGLAPHDVISQLDKQILFDPGANEWVTTDAYLSG